MKTAIVFLLIFNLLAVLAKVEKVKADPEDVWFWNGTTVTPAAKPMNPLATESTEKEFYDILTCTVALQKANKVLAEFTALIKGKIDDWTAYAASEKLNKFSYYLDKGCEGTDLKLINQGIVGLNETEDEACENLTDLIEPFVSDDEDDDDKKRILSSSFLSNLGTSKKALKLKNTLGAECKLVVIEKVDKSKIEEHSLPPLVFLSAKKGSHSSGHSGKEEDSEKEEKTEKKKDDEGEDEEEDEKQEKEKENPEDEKEEQEEKGHQKKEKVKEEPTNEIIESVSEEANLDRFVLRIDNVEDDHVDSYTISYHQEPNGDESVVIAHVTVKEITDETEDAYLASM